MELNFARFFYGEKNPFLASGSKRVQFMQEAKRIPSKNCAKRLTASSEQNRDHDERRTIQNEKGSKRFKR
jgi:hypothetical protein